MTAVLRFGYLNSVISGTVGAAGSAALPASNLTNPLGASSTGWQTAAGTTTSWVRFDAGASTVFDCFALFKTNLTTSATVQWRTFTSNAYSTPVYDSTALAGNVQAGYGQSILLPASPPTGQYYQVDIVDTGNPDTFLNVPLAYAGPLVKPTVGYSQSTALQTVTGNVATTSKFGQTVVSNYWTARQWVLNLQGVKSTEWQTFLALDLAGKRGSNILFIPNASDTAANINIASVYGLLSVTQTAGYSAMSADLRTFAATITERL